MTTAVTPHDALVKAIAAAGSQRAFARLVGVAQPSVWVWVQHQTGLPPKHAAKVIAIEAATGVSRHDLAPDIYPRDLAPFTGPTSTPEEDPA